MGDPQTGEQRNWENQRSSPTVSEGSEHDVRLPSPGIRQSLGITRDSDLKGSVQFSCSVVSASLRPHGLQHTRLRCSSPTPGACLNSCPSSEWCHPTISSSVVPFSSHLQSFAASGSFPVSQFFASGGQSIGVSLQHQSWQWIFSTNFL